MDNPAGQTSRGRGRPVGADSESTRRCILDAARDVIADRGYHGATFRLIAARAGVSRPTLHYYFDSRDHIYEVLLAAVYERVAEVIAEAQAEVGPRRQLACFTRALQRWNAEENAIMRFLVAARLEHHRGVHRSEAGARVFSAVHAFYDAVVAGAVGRGELRSGVDAGAVADTLAVMFWGMGFHSGFVAMGTAGDATAGIAGQLLNVFEHGLLDAHAEAPADN